MNRKEKKAAAERRRQELTADLLNYLEEMAGEKGKVKTVLNHIGRWTFNRSAKDPQCRSMYLGVAARVRNIMTEKSNAKAKNIIRWMRKNWRLPDPSKEDVA